MKKRVAVGMSGGVDSSFAALKLKEEGYDVIGVTMLASREKYEIGKCCSINDIEDAKIICKKLGIQHYIIDLQNEFEKFVIEPFINDFYNLKTPNPCITCNQYLKFGLLMDYSLKNFNVDYFATGHYARIKDGKFILKAIDKDKDQSYFLYKIEKERLKNILFPCGSFLKKDIKDEVAFNNLINPYSKKESYDICFIKGKDYSKFLLSNNKGNNLIKGFFLTQGKKKIKEHNGTIFYTIGQRKGLNISLGERVYVREIQENGDIVLGEKPLLKEIEISDTNFFIPLKLLKDDKNKEYKAKIRYRTKEVSCLIDFEKSSQNNFDSIFIKFLETIEASSPGQSAVIYDGDVLIGGGIINKIYLLD
jgi:tRNA-specific 2-thiouridylase